MVLITLSEVILVLFSVSVGWNSSETRGLKHAVQTVVPFLKENTETSKSLLKKLTKAK